MPVKLLLPMRLLNSSLPVTRFLQMKPPSSANPHPIFARMFPFKLQHKVCSSRPRASPRSFCGGYPGVRTFSTRPLRSRPSSDEVRASKSLIDDEAELSDWVSDLHSNSFRDESDSGSNSNRAKIRDSGRDRESSGFSRRGDADFGGGGRGRGRGRESLGFSRQRDRDFGRSSRNLNLDWDSTRGRGRGGEKGRGRDSGLWRGGDTGRSGDFRSPPRNSRGGGSAVKRGFGSYLSEHEDEDDDDFDDDDVDVDDEDDDEIYSPRNGGVNSAAKKKRTGLNSSWSNRQDQGSRGLKKNVSARRGALLVSDEDNDDDIDADDEDDGENYSSRNGGVNSAAKKKRTGLNSRWSNKQDQGSRGLKKNVSAGRGVLLVSDEDNDGGRGHLMDSFKDLLSDQDADDNEEEEEDDVLSDDLGIEGSLLKSSKQSSSRVSSPGGSDSYLSGSRFDQCSISALSLKGIKDAGYENMTVVQEATLPVILKGKDVLAKARTGTGKTVAFLLPSIEVVVKSPPAGCDQKRPPIIVLVVCPTRELASQAAKEADKLLKYHPSIGVQVVIGGTRLAVEQKRMQANPCQILVATPGRLRDHIENTAGFATRLMGVKVLVLDEADHLLDMGFRKDIEKIIAAVPKQRQTLLFSATVPPEVRQICYIALKRDHEFINTVQEGTEETHSQVQQMHLIAPLANQFPLIYALLKEHISDDADYKVLVFCTTAMVTRLLADLLGELNLNVREIHSRKPQSYRTRVSDEFRKSKGLILVTSDVSARGVDYPDVTLVIQVGLPADRQQYIHRLGRTGRKGKEGKGILLLAPWEEFFLSTVKDLPITKAPVPLVDPDTKKTVERALSHVEMKNKEAAYQAWLGYYNSNKNVSRDKCRLVELANDFSRSMGLANPPAIPKLVLGKMGLRNIPGLRSK